MAAAASPTWRKRRGYQGKGRARKREKIEEAKNIYVFSYLTAPRNKENPRKIHGNTADMPREVKFLAVAREFRGNGNDYLALGGVRMSVSIFKEKKPDGTA
jgi:hypothetical protein